MGQARKTRALGIVRRNVNVLVLLLSGLLVVGAVWAYRESPRHSAPPDPGQMVHGGSWYVREPWPHDGKPYETEHFVVFSDGASLNARQRLAVLAEEVLTELIDQMAINPATMFRFPADQEKIDIYANRYNVLEGGGARAYYAGIIIWSFDYEAGREPTDVGTVRINLKHELVHVVEALLKGRFVGDLAVGDSRRMPVWFSEGAAEALSGGSTGGAPRSLDEVNDLIARYGRINPISWRVDLPLSEVADSYPHYYYPMAQLAVEYLLDPRGMGKSPENLTAVMLDMGTGASFADAFEAHIGISESDYEARFFALMADYLPQGGDQFPVATVVLASLSMLAAILMAGSLAWGLRLAPGAPYATARGALAWGAGPRRAFLVEIVAMALIAVALVALLLFRVTLSDLPPGSDRVPGYVIAAANFLAAAAILDLAIQRWADGSRAAYFVPLLVIVAAGITVVAVDLVF